MVRPAVKAPKSKGGKAGRECAPECNVEQVVGALEEYVTRRGVETAFEWGLYLGVPTGFAVRSRGLLVLAELISVLLGSVPCGLFKLCQLKTAWKDLCFKIPALMDPKQNLEKAATRWGERIMCVLNHIRRIRWSSVRMRQALKGLSASEQKQLEALAAQVQMTSTGVADPDNAPSAAAPKRALKKNDSIHSLDSEGFPNILKDVSASETLHYEDEDAGAGEDGDVGSEEAQDDASDASLVAEALNAEPMPARKRGIKEQVQQARVAKSKQGSISSKNVVKSRAGKQSSKASKVQNEDSKKAKQEVTAKQYISRDGLELTEENRLSAFPEGCSRCRHVPGCTVSCRAKRDV